MSPTNSTDPSAFLRASLRGNAAFSLLSGSLFTLAGGAVAGFIGVSPAALVTSTGLNLLAFAAALLWVASRPVPPPTLVKIIIGLDVGWVVGTAVAVFADVFSATGATAAVGVANVVLLFAVLQGIGLRRATQQLPSAA